MKYAVTIVVLYGLFFLMCYMGTGSTSKNMSSTNYYSYPDSVQEKIRQDHDVSRMIPAERNTGKVFLSNLVLFTVVFVLVGLILGVRTFKEAFLFFLLLGEGLGLFDLLVVDFCWWRHSERIRLKGIGRAEDYLDMKKHIQSFLRGIPMFAIASLLAAGILSVFN